MILLADGTWVAIPAGGRGIDQNGNGDGSRDLDPGQIFFWGASAGAMYGTMFVGPDPSVSAAVLSVRVGSTPEHARWSPVHVGLRRVIREARASAKSIEAGVKG